MSQAITTARPYAQAAFEEAQKQSALPSWSALLTDLAEAVQMPEVAALLDNPKVSKVQLAGLMEALIGTHANTQQKNFVRILVENQRLRVLPEIAAMYEMLKAEAEKSVNVVVESAFELSTAQQEKIAAAMKKRLGREIKLACNVNKDLLGGVVIRAGDKVIDGSVRTRLGDMASALA
ncbi:MAG: F0F1 ATP synthase subunit delta [Sideroxydans sp.]